MVGQEIMTNTLRQLPSTKFHVELANLNGLGSNISFRMITFCLFFYLHPILMNLNGWVMKIIRL